ncbi:hypothetical protein [Kitasatospora sp. NPDC088134]|uniref:hypothetical protein n=1 Tax=Kitasatospora sp. NPDC088134 TaxID=3364071 RepID=UPI0038242C4D
MTSPSDQELWAAVVSARRELNRVQAEFYQNATDSTGVLRDALRERGWGQTTALRHLDGLSRDTLDLLPELVCLVISDRTHRWAVEAIDHISHDKLMPALTPLVRQHLDSEDAYEYGCLASLAARIQAWPLLQEIVQRALSSADPEIRELGRFYAERYDFLQGVAQDELAPGETSSAANA